MVACGSSLHRHMVITEDTSTPSTMPGHCIANAARSNRTTAAASWHLVVMWHNSTR